MDFFADEICHLSQMHPEIFRVFLFKCIKITVSLVKDFEGLWTAVSPLCVVQKLVMFTCWFSFLMHLCPFTG